MVMKIKFDKICYDLKFFLEDIFKISIDIKKLKPYIEINFTPYSDNNKIIIKMSKTEIYIVYENDIEEYLESVEEFIEVVDMYIYDPKGVFSKKQNKTTITDKDKLICFEINRKSKKSLIDS